MKILDIHQLRTLSDQQIRYFLTGKGSSARPSLVVDLEPALITVFVRLGEHSYLMELSHPLAASHIKLRVNPQGLQEPEWRQQQLQRAHANLRPFLDLWGSDQVVTPMQLNQGGVEIPLCDFEPSQGLIRMAFSLVQHGNPLMPTTAKSIRMRQSILQRRRQHGFEI